MATLATRCYWTKRQGDPEQSGTRPDEPDDAAAELEEDGEEPEQPDEDHAQGAATRSRRLGRGRGRRR